jgi:hypothetical protein
LATDSGLAGPHGADKKDVEGCHVKLCIQSSIGLETNQFRLACNPSLRILGLTKISSSD